MDGIILCESISMMLNMLMKQMLEILKKLSLYLTALKEEFRHYFLKVNDKELNLVNNLFRCSVIDRLRIQVFCR